MERRTSGNKRPADGGLVHAHLDIVSRVIRRSRREMRRAHNRLKSAGGTARQIAARFQQFQRAYENQNYGIAYQHFAEALDLDAGVAYRYFVVRASAQVEFTARATGRVDELTARLDALLARHPNMNLLCDDDPDSIQRLCELREANIKKGLPSVALITLPKSASISVANIFTSGFNLPSFAYSFITVGVMESWAHDYARGGACYATHLRPTPSTVERLKRSGISKIIVHVRDPRQTLLSTVHHLSLYPDQLITLTKTVTHRPIAQQIDELMDFYIHRIRWIAGWMEAESKLDLMFSTFEDFVSDRRAFIQRYLDFYGAPPEHFSYESAVERHQGTDYHYRKGEISEWRNVFPSKQAAYLSSLVPKEVKQRFGWLD
jgi:hypothetical protein